MDVAIIGLEAHSEPIKEATGTLDEFTNSSKRAEAANDQRAASDRAATKTTKAHAEALKLQADAARRASFMQRNLVSQLFDIGTVATLAFDAPIFALQQLGFQTAQIAQLYMGQGGLGQAFRDTLGIVGGLVTRLGSLTGVLSVIGLGFAGLVNNIRDTSGEAVSFGNVATALFQEIASGVTSVAGPAINALGTLFSTVANGILEAIKLVGNSIINTFEFAYRAVLAIWSNLPAALGDLAFQAAQKMADGLAPIANLVGIDTTIPNPFAGRASDFGASLSDAASTFDNDRVGDFIGRVADRATALAVATNEAASGLGRTAQAAREAGEPLNLLNRSFEAANDNLSSYEQTFTGFFQSFSQQIQNGASFWEAFRTSAVSALNEISNRLIEMASQQLFANAFGGAGGGGGLFGGLLGGLFEGGGSFGLPPIYHTGTNFVEQTGPAILERGEAVIPAHMNPYAHGSPVNAGVGGAHVTVGVDVDASGNLVPFVTRISRGEASRMGERVTRSIPSAVDARTSERERRRIGPLSRAA